MRALGAIQRHLSALYRLDLDHDVSDFLRPLDDRDPEAHRHEVVLVDDTPEHPTMAVCLSEEVLRALAGEAVAGLSRFDAWCAAVEGVSHFTLLAWRAERERTVSQLELELQADVDKFALGLVQRALHRCPGEVHRSSGLMRRALFDRATFVDGADTARGRRYRDAHRLAARYAASLERRHLRGGRIARMLEELRDFYRSGATTRYEMAAG
jgi:hypothetical protein